MSRYIHISPTKNFLSAGLLAACCVVLSPPQNAHAQTRKAPDNNQTVRAQNRDAALPYELPEETPIVQGEIITGGPLPAPDDAVNPTQPPVRRTTPQPKAPQRSAPAPRKAPTPLKTPAQRASVAGISIAGLSDAVAQRRLRTALAPKLRASVTLTDGSRVFTARRDQLGATIPLGKLIAQARRSGGDIPLQFTVDAPRAHSTLRRLATQVNRKAEPFGIDLDAQGRVVARGGESATLSLGGSLARVRQALESSPPRGRVELVVARAASTGNSRTINDLGRIRYLLADFSTPYDAGIRGRTNNLRMAARNVNGTVVADGAVFSTNKAIGPRNAEAGWREAKMFVDGQVVSGTGAGICQCSTTIYNAALLAGLPIIERHPHTFRVNYAPASRDAAIYWGSKDLRFRNNTGGPIYVQTFLRGGRFHARLFGVRPVTNKIEVVARTLSRQGGTRSEAYRIVRSDGGTTRQRLSRDFYRPMP